MKVDLHCHSHYSDGKHAPDFLINRALANQLTHLAITDHDCTAALSEAIDISRDSALELIKGVEISCHWQSREIHVVGLFIDPDHAGIRRLLDSQQQARRERIAAIDERMQALGIHGLLEYVSGLPCLAYTRTHVADYLVEKGLCKNRQKAFKTYLRKGGRIYVGTDWYSMEETISTIRAAGGIAVLAHPARYPLGKKKLEGLVDDFSDSKGEAIEVSYSNIDPRTRKALSELALSKNLYASVGSDFHDAAAHWTDIGRIPPLDNAINKNAIWFHPRWHSVREC
jgi:predicted metal-dependent phosphoesterase TrpH